jgi:hypothetical protein
MVSCEMLSLIFSCTTRSANKRRLQRAYPSGGELHTSAITHASCSPSNLRLYIRLGRRGFKNVSNPSNTNRFRTRSTVGILTSNALQISWSCQPSSAFNSILACVNVRAFAVPEPISANNLSRSSTFRATMYFLAIAFPFQESILPFRSPINSCLTAY